MGQLAKPRGPEQAEPRAPRVSRLRHAVRMAGACLSGSVSGRAPGGGHG